MVRDVLSWLGRNARRIGVSIGGFVLLLVGVALLVLPGPGLLVIAGGLALLATEYEWARRLLLRVREKMAQATEAARRRLRRERS